MQPRRLSSLLFAAIALAALPKPSVALPVDSSAPAAAATGERTEAPTDGLGSAPAAGPLSSEQFLALVARDLAGHFGLKGDLQLELLRSWETPDRVARRWHVALLEYPAVPSSSMLVRCRITADGVVVSDTPLVLRAALWRDAWVARQPLGNGATFDPAALDVRRTDLFREREAVPATVGDRSYIFARSITAGRLLTWRDIARRPLVRKGDLVEVSASDGTLSITMKALAMQNGAQGETVQVRNIDSKKDFTAFVIDENRVQVRF
jgi:flagella basal body P-ring formation protein FlgA